MPKRPDRNTTRISGRIEITVLHYYGRSWYFPFMSSEMFEALEKAFLDDEVTALVPREDFEKMMAEWLGMLAN